VTKQIGARNPTLYAAPQGPVQTSATPMSEQRHEAVVNYTKRGMDKLYPTTPQATGQPPVSASMEAMGSEAAFREHLGRIFGPDADGELASRLVSMARNEAEDGQRYLGPLILATALKAQGVREPEDALSMLNSIREENYTPATFRLERALAASVAGTRMLAQVRGLPPGERPIGALREMLNLCSALEEKPGVDLSWHRSPQEVLQSLETNREAKMHDRIGEDDDGKLQLLAKALRHAVHHTAGNPLATYREDDRSAYVAWKKGGFTESGKGTDFNQAIGRLHKFLTYADRANHDERTLSNMARDVRSYFGRAVGVGKSPLSPMRHGTWGGHLGLVKDEDRKLKARLNKALQEAYRWQREELRDPAIANNVDKRHQLAARAAVFALWYRSTGSNEFSLADVRQEAERQLGVGPRATELDDKVLKKALKQFTRMSRGEDGQTRVRVTVKALEAVAANRKPVADAVRQLSPEQLRSEVNALRATRWRSAAEDARMNSLQACRREMVSDILSDLRKDQQVDGRAKPLFKWSDVKRLLRGTPREGPSAEDARQVMKAMTKAPNVGTSTYSDGASHGVGAIGSVVLSASSATGVPIVYPILELDKGRAAMVSVGNYPTGGRLFIGKESSGGAGVGVGGGWAAVPPFAKDVMSVGGFGEASVSRHGARTEGVAITAHNDQQGWRDALPNVVDFLFDEAARTQRQGRAATAADLWHRFADRFEADPHLSVSWVHEDSSNTNAQAGVFGTARAGTGVTRVGVGVRVGYSYDSFQATHASGPPGGDVSTSMHGKITNMTAGATLGETVPGKVFPADRMVRSWGLLAPLASISADSPHVAEIGIARLGRNRDGELSAPLCQREILFGSGASMIEYINRNRPAWEAALSRPEDEVDMVAANARRRLNEYIEELASTQSPVSLSGELATLSPKAAGRINALEAQIIAIRGEGDAQSRARQLSRADQDECRLLENEVRQILNTESNWMPAALYTADESGKAVNTGLAFGLRAVNQEAGHALHVTSLLAAAPPSAPPSTPTANAAATSSQGQNRSDNRSDTTPSASMSMSSRDTTGSWDSGSSTSASTRAGNPQGDVRPRSPDVSDPWANWDEWDEWEHLQPDQWPQPTATAASRSGQRSASSAESEVPWDEAQQDVAVRAAGPSQKAPATPARWVAVDDDESGPGRIPLRGRPGPDVDLDPRPDPRGRRGMTVGPNGNAVPSQDQDLPGRINRS
jgi:hypothetical protein